MHSKKRNLLIAAIALGFVCAANATAASDAYPNKPIRVIVPFLAGGITDVAARLVSKKMGEYLGQPIIVENRPGGDSIIGTRVVKDAAADGYTILATSNAYSLVPLLRRDAGYVPTKDFSGIGPMMTAPFVLDVGAEQPYQTSREFIAHARAEPEKIAFATPGAGSPNHIATEIFFRKTGIKNLTHVPFKGASAAVIEVAAGRIPFYVDAYTTSAPHIKSGKIRPLAVTSAKRMPILPNVPTLLEQGIDFTYEYWLGMLVRSGTPEHVVARLASALRYAHESPELQERFRNEGANLPVMKPADFDKLIDNEVKDAAKVLKDLGMQMQ